ncbi:lipocalin family protein [Bordetella sp. 2513F-2]
MTSYPRLLLAGAALWAGAVLAAAPPVSTVAAVDLSRYAGKWYEVARLPMPLEHHCVSDATVEYVQENGSIAVHHRCQVRNGRIGSASGSATVIEGSNNTKLKVSFPDLGEAEYWVIGLDPEYRWAVVGSPDRRYLWILSRAAGLTPEEREQALAAAREQGYDLAELRDTPQQ